MNVVLDASVVVAWLVEQSPSPAARPLRERYTPDDVAFAVPSLFMAEASSAILRSAKRKYLHSEDAMDAPRVALVERPYAIEPPPAGLDAWKAAKRAHQLDVSYDDYQYIDLALKHRAELRTVDARLHGAAGDAGVTTP